jgi:phosphonoacetate hydrolase
MDEKIGQLSSEDNLLGIVSDHGMNRKKLKVDLSKLLKERGIKAQMIPIIKDEYLEHHYNLGGSVYIYLEKRRLVKKAQAILSDQDGVEAVLTRREAARGFHLPGNRIGDLLVLAQLEAVFSPVDSGLYEDVDVRSHGSLHEQDVPFILNQKPKIASELFNKDILSVLWSLEP